MTVYKTPKRFVAWSRNEFHFCLSEAASVRKLDPTDEELAEEVAAIRQDFSDLPPERVFVVEAAELEVAVKARKNPVKLAGFSFGLPTLEAAWRARPLVSVSEETTEEA